ncbi:MAG: right-handed parallel beta-helix repeat-containing protein, partial [Methanobrevibacter sp.]|nr:right-handed parallel beta-helix repeat-containing protein [Methanobrevibacter sp.]
MKLKKYSLVILSISLILLVFVSSASAAESNETDILSIDESASTVNENLALDYSPDMSGESNDTNVIENNENSLLSADNDESGNVLREGTGTFANLQTEIRTALSSGDYVKLTKDTYIYAGSGSQIGIGKSCTIDGNGAVIDMAGSNIRAFNVRASDVTIKNLTIKNANYNGFGGAIYFSSSGTVENCNFINNKGTYGGAIDFDGEGTVTSCNFTGNKASVDYGYGGAISFGQSGTVENCNFTNNNAYGGGAVCFWGYGEVTNCNFTNNKATGLDSGGGAIYMSSGRVTNCNFTNNHAEYDGGAIKFTHDGTVTNCNFTNNSAKYGGAIDFDGEGTVTSCNFTNNMASSNGGAIWMSSGSVTNCNFADNSASSGGAIFSNSWYSIADTCIFKRNSGENVNTVIFPPTLNVDNFTTFYGSTEKLTFDLKTNSSIPVTNGNISLSVYFKDNDSWVGDYSCLSGEGWIPDLPVGSYYAIFDTEYAEFKPINRTITIIPEYTFWALNHTINGNNNSVINLSNDYYFDSEYDSEFVNGVVINRPLTINGNGYTINALQKASIFNVNSGNVVLNNITFTNATSGSGGAVYFSSSGSVTNCNFTNNFATRRGGAVYFYEEGTVTNCNFTGNKATGSNSEGGAIWMGSGSVTNCNFTSNQAKYGGAVLFSS